MIHVYRIPDKRSDGYCFGGYVPVPFYNVDWMDDPPDDMTPEDAAKFISGKIYFTMAAPGTRFLVLCDKGPEWTFQIVR